VLVSRCRQAKYYLLVKAEAILFFCVVLACFLSNFY
jgi:hypothetical protein